MGPNCVSFNPAHDIPSLTGKTILVTGGNTGLGKQSVLELSRHNPLEIWLSARSEEKGRAAIADIKREVPNAHVMFLELDLSSFESIKQAAKMFLASASHLDILMLNAGIMACPPGLTKDGYEIQFGTNHMGHALLVKLLMPVLLKTADKRSTDVRIVSVSSVGHRFALHGGIQFDTLKCRAENVSTHALYGQSKMANIIYAAELARQHPTLKVVSVHPGLVNTNLYRVEGKPLLRAFQTFIASIMGRGVNDGAKNQLWACVAPDVDSGEYYEPIGVAGKGSKEIKDIELARKLWDWTQKEIEGQEFVNL
ncbi:hypothetical protein B0O99DRAFT_727129 [Bisporella sp. PMI_857]|nr:hypothetical protein B0O99DRAFT_727129 [Bisporella sp. PMI_857]